MTEGKWGILFIILAVVVSIVGDVISIPILSNICILGGIALAVLGGYKLRELRD